MATVISYAHIVSTPGVCGGRPRIDGHRIKVQDIATFHERHAMTPAQIQARFPVLTLAQIYSVLAFYYDHRDEIAAEIKADDKLIENLEREHPQSGR